MAFDKFLMIPLDIGWLNYYGRFKFEVFLDSKNDLVLKAKPVSGKRKRCELCPRELKTDHAV